MWQRFMYRLFGEVFEPHNFDDIIKICFKIVFDNIIQAGLTINIKKCKFSLPEHKYLGYVVNNTSLHVESDKINAIVKIPPSKNFSEITTLMECRRDIDDFS